MKKFLNFLTYNNAVPIGMGILFLGAGGALAATPAVQQSIYSSAQTVESVDNTFIVNADLDTIPLSIQVTGVSEDSDNYYVSYTMNTVDIQNDVWQNVAKAITMTVSKAQLNGGDLGLFVSSKLSDVRAQELDRLQRTQVIEKRNGESQKVVATAYSGLVGKFLNPTEQTFPGYTPVVVEPVDSGTSVPVTDTAAPDSGQGTPATPTPPVTTTVSGDPTDTVPPTIQILGNNPAQIDVGSSYEDLGAIVTDNKSLNIGYTTMLDGNVGATTITIDTTVAGTHTITYTAVDQAGNSTSVTRTVIITDPNQPAATTPEVTPPPDTPAPTPADTTPPADTASTTAP